MAYYTRYKTETLRKMLDAAWEKYYAATTKPSGSWGDSMRLAKLSSNASYERARDRYYAIKAELQRRGIKGGFPA